MARKGTIQLNQPLGSGGAGCLHHGQRQSVPGRNGAMRRHMQVCVAQHGTYSGPRRDGKVRGA